MTQHVLDIVTAYQDAWTSGDLIAAATYLAPDFTFEGAGASFTSTEEFLPFLARFAGRIGRGWRKVAAFGDGDEMLVMYELHGPTGQALPPTVDHSCATGRSRRRRWCSTPPPSDRPWLARRRPADAPTVAG